jgi:hypothetical protein
MPSAAALALLGEVKRLDGYEVHGLFEYVIGPAGVVYEAPRLGLFDQKCQTLDKFLVRYAAPQ